MTKTDLTGMLEANTAHLGEVPGTQKLKCPRANIRMVPGRTVRYWKPMRRRDFLRGCHVVGATMGWNLIASGESRMAFARPAGLAARLAELGASLDLRLTRFEHGHPHAISDVSCPATPGDAKLVLEGATVACHVRVSPARNRIDATDIEVAFRVVSGRLPDASVAVTLSLGRWSRDCYLVIPGAVYAGNRFASRHIPYPPLLSEPSDIGPHVPPIISDIPRLNIQPGESRIVLAAADTAAPTIGVRLTGAGTGPGFGLVLIGEPVTTVGQTGLMVVENADRSAATLTVAAPCVRPDVRYALCNNRVPSSDRGTDLDLGTTIVLRQRLLAFPCPDVQTLFDRWFEARRDGIGPVKSRHELPLLASRRLIEERMALEQWADVPGIFATRSPTAPLATTAEPDRESTFQTGADGALALVLPALATGAPEARARAASVLDFQLRGQAASGFFHAASDGTAWWDEGGAPPMLGGAEARGARSRRWTHIGRNAEALFLAMKQVLLLQQLEPSYRLADPWRTGLARCADAFVRLWSRSKQFGQYVSVDSGDITVGGSTAGALAPAALALSAQVLDTEGYLRVAVAAAEAFHTRFVQNGMTLGGAPAALQCPDSRSAAGLLTSFVTLAEATGESIWFDRAAEIAHQLASWTVAWDAPLPADSTLGKLGARTTGAVLVSAQDKWGLPGFAGLSGDALFRLYRATGRVAYLELLRETVHGSTQYVATLDRRPDPDCKPGWVAGRIPIGDALGSPGEVGRQTPAGTAQAACLMIAAEIPSIYVQPDTGFLFVFDHVEARVREKTPERLRITVHNPTRFDTEVRILAELDRERSRPLGAFPLVGLRSLTLVAGATDDVEFSRSSS